MAEEPVQRRLAAILAADVVGYSRIMEADEAALRARLPRSSHQGTLHRSAGPSGVGPTLRKSE